MNRRANGSRGKHRLDYELIQALVPSGSRVLDLGCGDGQLLADLIRQKGCQGRGIEIDEQAVVACVRRGVPVYHGDMLEKSFHLGDLQVPYSFYLELKAAKPRIQSPTRDR